AVTSYRRVAGITAGRVPPRAGAVARSGGRQRPAGCQAARIRADRPAGGALAASPRGRPLTPGRPLPSLSPPTQRRTRSLQPAGEGPWSEGAGVRAAARAYTAAAAAGVNCPA